MRLIIFLAISLSGQLAFAQGTCKCCSEEFRQFDFWIGEWRVVDTARALLGTSRIEVIQDSCVLLENWSSARSTYTGTSLNFFDTAKGKWTQTWVDNQGGSLLLHGSMVGQSMQLISEETEDAQGRKLINRITWTPKPEGTVRQLWETQVDGTEWTTVFEGLYMKRE